MRDGNVRTWAPIGDCKTSVTADTAEDTLSNWATATEVGNLGVNRNVAVLVSKRRASLTI